MPFFKKSNKRSKRRVKKTRKNRRQHAGWGSASNPVEKKELTSFFQQYAGWGGPAINTI